MKKKILTILMVFVLVLALISGIAFFYFRNVSMLLAAALTHTNPPFSYLTDVRKTLLDQKDFQRMLKQHEAIALARFKGTGNTPYTKRHIYKLPMSMFDMPFFHDYWETWVRTDIVQGLPRTSFLIRLGIIKEKNDISFFSNQCQSKTGKTALRFLISAYNKFFDWGILKPYRINITESNKTSSIGSKRLSLEKWNDMVEKLHHGKE
jgi:hypothetical protein